MDWLGGGGGWGVGGGWAVARVPLLQRLAQLLGAPTPVQTLGGSKGTFFEAFISYFSSICFTAPG